MPRYGQAGKRYKLRSGEAGFPLSFREATSWHFPLDLGSWQAAQKLTTPRIGLPQAALLSISSRSWKSCGIGFFVAVILKPQILKNF
jgi:hypothetical protein